MGVTKIGETKPAARYVPWYRNTIVLGFCVMIAIACAAGLTRLYIGSKEYIYIDDAMVQGDKITVSSRQPGRVSNLLVAEGSYVKKGQLLVQLDKSEIVTQKAQAEAAVLLAQENMKLCATGAGKALGDFGRAQIQFQKGYMPKEQYDHAENQRDAATIQRAIAAAQAASARAQLDLIKTQMEAFSIYAIDDGVVAKKWISAGDVIQPGQPVYTLYNLHGLSVVANVEETKYQAVRPGQTAIVTVDAYPGRTWTGKVVSSGPCTASQFAAVQSTSSTGEFTKLTQYLPVRIALDSTENSDITGTSPILPGMSVEVRLKGIEKL